MAEQIWRNDPWHAWLADEGDRERYDGFVRGAGRGNPLQRWSWGEVKRADGWFPHRVWVERGGCIEAAVSVVERRLRGGMRMWWAHRGPVAEPGSAGEGALVCALRQLAARRQGVAFLRLDPEWAPDESSRLAQRGAVAVPIHARWYLGAMEPIRVWRISLDGGADAVFSRFATATRNDIRRSARKGVLVRQGEGRDLAAFYRLEQATAARKGFAVRSEAFFERLWRAWEADGDGVFLVAEVDGEMAGGVMAVVCGAGAWGQFAAIDAGKRDRLPGPALYWSMIRWAIERGASFLDFGGVDHRDGAADGVRAFKQGFGPGDTRFGGEYDLVFRPWLYRAMRLGEDAFWRWQDRRLGGA